jgi:hypothetical protein
MQLTEHLVEEHGSSLLHVVTASVQQRVHREVWTLRQIISMAAPRYPSRPPRRGGTTSPSLPQGEELLRRGFLLLVTPQALPSLGGVGGGVSLRGGGGGLQRIQADAHGRLFLERLQVSLEALVAKELARIVNKRLR